MTIWKYPLLVQDIQALNMPVGAAILTVQSQGTMDLCLWAIVCPKAPTELRLIEIIGTGHPIKDGTRKYIGTVQQHGGALVWHIFERMERVA